MYPENLISWNEFYISHSFLQSLNVQQRKYVQMAFEQCLQQAAALGYQIEQKTETNLDKTFHIIILKLWQ